MESIKKLFLRLLSPNKKSDVNNSSDANKEIVSPTKPYSCPQQYNKNDDHTFKRILRDPYSQFRCSNSDIQHDKKDYPSRFANTINKPSQLNYSNLELQSNDFYSIKKAPKFEESFQINDDYNTSNHDRINKSINFNTSNMSSVKCNNSLTFSENRSKNDTYMLNDSHFMSSNNIYGVRGRNDKFQHNTTNNFLANNSFPAKYSENYHLSLIENSSGHDILKRLNQLSQMSRDQYSSFAFPNGSEKIRKNISRSTNEVISTPRRRHSYNMFSLPTSQRSSSTVSQVGKAKLLNPNHKTSHITSNRSKTLCTSTNMRGKTSKKPLSSNQSSLMFDFKSQPYNIEQYNSYKLAKTLNKGNQNLGHCHQKLDSDNNCLNPWKCFICTFMNDARVNKCDACDTPRPCSEVTIKENEPIIDPSMSKFESNTDYSNHGMINSEPNENKIQSNGCNINFSNDISEISKVSSFKFDPKALSQNPTSIPDVFSSNNSSTPSSGTLKAKSMAIDEPNRFIQPKTDQIFMNENPQIEKKSPKKSDRENGASSVFTFDSFAKHPTPKSDEYSSENNVGSANDKFLQPSSSLSENSNNNSLGKTIKPSSLFTQSLSNVNQSEMGSFLSSKPSSDSNLKSETIKPQNEFVENQPKNIFESLFAKKESNDKSLDTFKPFITSESSSSNENKFLFPKSNPDHKPTVQFDINQASSLSKNQLDATVSETDSSVSSKFIFQNKSTTNSIKCDQDKNKEDSELSLFAKKDPSSHFLSSAPASDLKKTTQGEKLSLFSSDKPNFDIKNPEDQKSTEDKSQSIFRSLGQDENKSTPKFSLFSHLSKRDGTSSSVDIPNSNIFNSTSSNTTTSQTSQAASPLPFTFTSYSSSNDPSQLFNKASNANNTISLFSFQNSTDNVTNKNIFSSDQPNTSVESQNSSQVNSNPPRSNIFTQNNNNNNNNDVTDTPTSQVQMIPSIFNTINPSTNQNNSTIGTANNTNDSNTTNSNTNTTVFNLPTNRVIRKAIRRIG